MAALTLGSYALPASAATDLLQAAAKAGFVGGISATPVDYTKPKATQYGRCVYVVEIKGNQWASLQKTPICGTAISS